MNNRERVLEKAKECVLKDRNSQYGEPEDLFGQIANLWNAYMGADLIKSTDVCNMLSLLKIARAKSNPEHIDNFIDLAGYAACAAECVSKKIVNGINICNNNVDWVYCSSLDNN